MTVKKWIPAALLILALAACDEEAENGSLSEETPTETSEESVNSDSSDESGEETQESEQDVLSAIGALDIPAPPESTEEFIRQKSGPMGSAQIERSAEKHKEEFLEAFGDIPALPEEATEEELDAYFNYIYYLTAYSFPDPKHISDQMQFSLSGTPEAEERFQFKENYNVEIILDASGSMGAYAGDQTRMEQAKEEINSFLSSVPEEANVSLRVYGHEGTGDEADKAKSCGAIEEVYERGPYESAAFQEALNQFDPAGWTPVAGALESSAESFADLDAEENTNLVYLVSDGIETCDGDPVAAAKSFADSNVSPIINVIGFNADSETQAQLRDVAESADGIFTNVNNAAQLREEFKQTEDILLKWKRWKQDASIDLTDHSNTLAFEIIDLSNDWDTAELGQKLSLYNANQILREEGKLTLDQQKILEDKADEVQERSNQARETLKAELEKLNEEEEAEIQKQIEALYPDEAE
ncbi:vWA domain-containing protein [Jeotgalibacillus haloalkalitolerans]|uniref:VWA domain-containing protein n=1 Tax=Jeotgalibacillus haloalkalitolerans TaxID=3104292 RepID=A0ABU5KRV9_9BACL|nr:VWA domain-containing protein [Jeotgalibacillus sp. HH7-29]MDZ5713681.1 VWA domain-containing protein [Jeotgalibacillus sp. HH7-29]